MNINMKTKNHIQKITKFSIFTILIISLWSSNIQVTQVLDLFDGVIKSNASGGNISPTRICSSNGYIQTPETPTQGNIVLSTPLNTSIDITRQILESSITTPQLRPSESIFGICPQSFPQYGELYSGLSFAGEAILPYDRSTTSSSDYIVDGISMSGYHPVYVESSTNTFNKFYYQPPIGFKGVACFDLYTMLYSNLYNDTNVAQVKIQVGGSTSNTCGADTTTGVITGKIYPDLNGNGVQDTSEPDYSASNPLPSDILIGLYQNNQYLSINQDGTFFKNLVAGSYDMYISKDGYKISVSDSTNTFNSSYWQLTSQFITNTSQDLFLGNFGFYSEPDYIPYTTSGYVYEDINDNGVKDQGEKGIPNVQMNSFDGYYGISNTVYTDINGKYILPTAGNDAGVVITEIQPENYEDGKDSFSYNVQNEGNDSYKAGEYSWSVNNNFGEIPKPQQTQAGEAITIVADSKSAISSIQNTLNAESPKLVESMLLATKQPIELVFTKNNRRSGTLNQKIIKDKDGLDITDPYICELRIITGNVKYTGDKKDLDQVSLKLKNFNSTSKSYSFNSMVDDNGDYQVDVKDIENGNYQVEYSISDKLGNTANGTYTFEKKNICDEINYISPQTQIRSSQNLTRTGGETSGLVHALSLLIFTMFIGSHIQNSKAED
jgi:hypothetical protein